jgi:hypothetical protein
MSGIEDPHRKRPPTALKNAFDWFAVTRRASIISSPRARSIVEPYAGSIAAGPH